MATKKAKKKAAKKPAKKTTAPKKRTAAVRPGSAPARGGARKTAKKAKAGKAVKLAKAAKGAKAANAAKAAKRVAPAKKAAARHVAKPVARRAAAKAPPVRRRDHEGHIDPKYAAELRAKSGGREEDPRGFIDRPRANDDLVEELAEEFVEEATSAEHEGEDVLDQEVPEEVGGPFVETTADQDFAHGTDPSNPKGAKREPFPTT
jgi:hypothetical protein